MRLSDAALARLPPGVRQPGYDRGAVQPGIVHLGIGAFHRAHQAAYTDEILALDGGWGICGYTQRSTTVRDQLAPQDGCYTVLERGDGAAPPRVIGSVREVRSALDDVGPSERIADPRVRLVRDDFFDLVRTGRADRTYDAVLVDIDHAPDWLLRDDHGDLYTVEGFGRVGAMLQTGGMPTAVKVGELVEFARGLYPQPIAFDTILATAGLSQLADRRVEGLSGGEAQRLRFALAIAGDPDLLFLDEPTVAMDVESRRAFWKDMREFAEQGRTVAARTAQRRPGRVSDVDRGHARR